MRIRSETIDAAAFLLCRAAIAEALRDAGKDWRHRQSASRRFLFLIVLLKSIARIHPKSESSTCFSVYW